MNKRTFKQINRLNEISMKQVPVFYHHLTNLDNALQENTGDAYRKIMMQAEKPVIERTLVTCRGNQTKAAEMLGLNRGTLRKKMKEHGLMRA